MPLPAIAIRQPGRFAGTAGDGLPERFSDAPAFADLVALTRLTVAIMISLERAFFARPTGPFCVPVALDAAAPLVSLFHGGAA
jgi:hypothetical protein